MPRDEPFDISLVRHALSTRQRVKVTNARENPLPWNLMWPIAGLSDGSFYFDNQPNMLDQFLVNKNMATGAAPIKVTTPSQSLTAEWAIRSIRTDSPTTSQSR